MIAINVEQGTPEWLNARKAIPTASQFHRIVTRKRKKLSASSGPYMCELLAEWLLDKPLGAGFESGFMERGSELEIEARNFYELDRQVETTKVGFALLGDNRLVGCSPDGLVGDDGGLEIKSPSPGKHVENMLGVNSAYEMQCQGCMWICDRNWWDLLSYHPELPPAIVRVSRDDEFIGQLAAAVFGFVERLLLHREQLAEHRVKRDVA